LGSGGVYHLPYRRDRDKRPQVSERKPPAIDLRWQRNKGFVQKKKKNRTNENKMCSWMYESAGFKHHSSMRLLVWGMYGALQRRHLAVKWCAVAWGQFFGPGSTYWAF
jgi:hypothetical protein